MAAQKFSKLEAIKFGFEAAKSQYKFFIPMLLVATLINFIPGFINDNLLRDGAQIIKAIVGIAGWIVSMLISLGMIKISLNYLDHKKLELAELFMHYKLLFSYWAGSILYGLIVFAGLLLLIVPGIIWMVKLQFYSYLIIDRGLGPIEALKQSWNMTKGVKLDLFLFGLLAGVINLLGVLALLVGLFWTLPTTMIATAYIYRKLAHKA
jgi:uncharacterized membrane protein